MQIDMLMDQVVHIVAQSRHYPHRWMRKHLGNRHLFRRHHHRNGITVPLDECVNQSAHDCGICDRTGIQNDPCAALRIPQLRESVEVLGVKSNIHKSLYIKLKLNQRIAQARKTLAV
ncbi:MAG TPA: hypothetical protein VNX00_04430 [Herbaspirillum sp.]|nr:hypothetical protein [Herbaspirillum sp.]